MAHHHATNDRTSSVHETTVDIQSNVAYGYVDSGMTSSVPAEYETPITTTVDVQSNVAYGHVSGGKIPSTAVYEIEIISPDL